MGIVCCTCLWQCPETTRGNALNKLSCSTFVVNVRADLESHTPITTSTSISRLIDLRINNTVEIETEPKTQGVLEDLSAPTVRWGFDCSPHGQAVAQAQTRTVGRANPMAQ